MIAAIAAIDGASLDGDRERALSIGYELESLGAPGDYRAALAARGGTGYAARVLLLAETLRGPPAGTISPPPESGPLDPPVPGPVRAGFGLLYGRPHLGIDFDARDGSPVRAAADGIVTEVGSAPAYGRYLCMLHAFPGGLRGERSLTSCYGYLTEATRRPGEVVGRREQVAVSGCSGQYCVSPRVHFILRPGVRPDGVPVDPAPYLRDGGRGS